MNKILPTPNSELTMKLEETQTTWASFNWQEITHLIFMFVLRMAAGVLIIFIGFKVINFLSRFTKKSLTKRQVSPTLVPFLVTLINLGGKFFVILAAASVMGMTSASLAAVLGTLGLALGLALQGSLANFAGGVLLLALKPFVVGDYIRIEDGKGQEGKVKSIQIFYTHLATLDNKTIIIPNGNIMKTTIINFTHEGKRRLEIKLKLDHKTNLKKAKEIALSVIKSEPRVLPEPVPGVYVLNIDEYGVDFSIRAWVKRQELFKVKTSLIEKIKAEFDHAGIKLARPVVGKQVSK